MLFRSGLSRALIQAQSYLVEIGLRVDGQVGFLREVLASLSVGLTRHRTIDNGQASPFTLLGAFSVVRVWLGCDTIQAPKIHSQKTFP